MPGWGIANNRITRTDCERWSPGKKPTITYWREVVKNVSVVKNNKSPRKDSGGSHHVNIHILSMVMSGHPEPVCITDLLVNHGGYQKAIKSGITRMSRSGWIEGSMFGGLEYFRPSEKLFAEVDRICRNKK